MSLLLVVIDGMTDESYDLAQMPMLNDLAKTHASGLLDITPPDEQPETTACILTMLGILPQQAGRGWLEALGAGIEFAQGDILCKASWIWVDENGCITGLCSTPPQFKYLGYHYLGGWQALVVLPDEACNITELKTFLPHQNIGNALQQVWPQGNQALHKLCSAARRPACALIPWGEAVPAILPHRQGVVITATAGVRGIARACGMQLVDVNGATGDVDTNIEAKVLAALAAAKESEFVLLHLNGADEAGHRRDAKAKREFLQKVDGWLPMLAQSGYKLLICADHGTSPDSGKHLNGAQPFVLVNSNKKGELGTQPGGMAATLLQGGCKWQNQL